MTFRIRYFVIDCGRNLPIYTGTGGPRALRQWHQAVSQRDITDVTGILSALSQMWYGWRLLQLYHLEVLRIRER